MDKHDNFEDNIYLLMGRIKNLRDSTILDMDPEIFLDKTLEDIDFFDKTLELLLQRILENQWSINRKELLHHLSELDWQFSQVLQEILDGSGSISIKKIPSLKEKMTILRKKSLDRRNTAETTGAAVTGDNPEEPVISSNELNELLKDF